MSSRVPKEYQDRLGEFKENINFAFCEMRDNNERFQQCKVKVFKTTLSTQQKDALMALNKPPLEFNMLNAPIDRLSGEYSKQMPSLEVSAKANHHVEPARL